MKRLFFILGILLAFGPAVFSQAPDDIVSVKVVAPDGGFPPGRTVPAVLELTIRPPFHINSDRPGDEDLIGTTVVFQPQAGVTYGRPVFPRPLRRKLSFSEMPLSVFEGVIAVPFDVTVAADFAGKEWTIAGTVGYQACDDQTCLPPRDVSFSDTVGVTPAPASAQIGRAHV